MVRKLYPVHHRQQLQRARRGTFTHAMRHRRLQPVHHLTVHVGRPQFLQLIATAEQLISARDAARINRLVGRSLPGYPDAVCHRR